MDGQNNNGKTCMCVGNWCWHKKIGMIIVLVAIIIIIGSAFHHGHGNKNADQNTIVVNGTGTVTAVPDMATLSFSVTDENLDVAQATNAVNTKIAAIVKTLEADGLAAADIKTTDYSINPQYNYTNVPQTVNGMYQPAGTQVLAGYQVTDSISINIKNLANASKVVTDLGTAGVTDMSGLSFTNSNETTLEQQAEDQAIAEAKTKAASLAQALGVKLDTIVGYSDNQPVPVMYGAMNAMAVPASSVVQAVLPSGQNTITANVSVTYEIQ